MLSVSPPRTAPARLNPPRAALPCPSSAVALLVVGCLAALQPARAAPAPEFSEPAPLAPRSLLLGVARAGEALIAVGDRGHILRSTDEGRTWTQRPVPTRAMLTGVSFPDPTHGWAVGHDGVILATTDAGRTWQRQDDGADLDTIYFDVLFLDPTRGFAVGAYGKFAATTDGGRTWTPGHPTEEDIHYNRLTRSPAGALALAGEAGAVLISRDAGASWTRAELPYDGTLFGVLALDEQRLVAYGLRGHIFLSTDGGATWSSRSSEAKVLLMAAVRGADGAPLLAGQGGNFFSGTGPDLRFTRWQPADFGTGVSDLLLTTDGALLTVGEAGAVRVALP